MPRGTTLRNVRIDEPLWAAAKVKAARRGLTLSEVIRAALEEFVKRDD